MTNDDVVISEEEKKEVVVAVMPDFPAAEEGAEYVAEGNSLMESAKKIVVTTDEEYQSAAELGSEIKRRVGAVTDFFKPLKESAHKAHKAVCDREKTVLKPFMDAEKALKSAMADYLEEVERQRREREEYIRNLAQQQVNESINKAAELEAEGRTEEAEKVLNNAITAEEFQKSSIAVMPSETPKAKNASTTTGYEIVSIDEVCVPVQIAGVTIRPVDEKAIMRLIKATKGSVRIPGVEYKSVQKISIRR